MAIMFFLSSFLYLIIAIVLHPSSPAKINDGPINKFEASHHKDILTTI